MNNGIIRLYFDVDPALGKILRNIKLALERNKLFEQIQRFAETYLVPREIDPLFNNPPLPFDKVRDEFSKVALIHDNIPEMLIKLHKVIIEENTFQRAISFVSTGLLFKDIYHHGWDVKEHETAIVEQDLEKRDVTDIIDNVCKELDKTMYNTYVDKGKRSKNEFSCYMKAVKEILTALSLEEKQDDLSYFDYLKVQMPGLTKEVYAKKRLAEELKNNNL